LFFNKFSHHRECNEYSEIWSYYKEKGNTFVKLQYANFHCYVHLMGFRWVDTDQFLMFIRACGELCKINIQGRIQGGRPPPKIAKKYDFLAYNRDFHTKYENTPTIFAPSSTIGKNKIFWRKIVIFHTKYPNNFRSSLRSAQFF
jgi:hypothetical protein